MEEGVAGQDAGPLDQPVVERALLLCRRMKGIPAVDAPARGAQAGQTQLGAVGVGDGSQGVELGHVLARVTTTLILNCPKPAAARLSMAWRAAAKEPSPRTTSFVARGGPVDGDLHVEVVEGGQLGRALGAETGAVGGELDPDPPLDGVADQVHEVRAQHGLAAADVHVEHLEVDHLVDDVARLGRRQLGGITPARRTQAVHAGQVAGVGQLPGQADGCIEPQAELVLEGQRRCVSGHRSPPSRPGGTEPGRRRSAAPRG